MVLTDKKAHYDRNNPFQQNNAVLLVKMNRSINKKYMQTKRMSLEFLKKNIPTYLIHLFIWVALFSLPLLFRPHFGPGPQGRQMPWLIPIPMWTNFIFMVFAFYTNLLVLMPRFLEKKKWGLYIFFSCLFLAISFFLPSISREIDHFFGQNMMYEMGHRPHSTGGFEFRQFSFIYMFAIVWAISMVFFLFEKLQESLRRSEMIYAAALQSELSFLKAQVNPHFLFNTLNNIYALTLKKSDDASLAVMKLSNLMRKITTDSGVDFVPFEEEESFIRDYIELQELRLTGKTKVNYELVGNYDTLMIAPRILIPFIDNAFKYGVSNRYESKITIRFEFIDKSMFFTIENAIHPSGGESLESSGVGLENSQRRLDLLYKDKYNLKITKNPETYHILLKIELS